MLVQHMDGFLLGKAVDVVGVFDLVHQSDDFGAGKGHAQSDCCTSPGFGEV